MSTAISSRTPEGIPNGCPTCEAFICIEPSQPSGDAPCPNCGMLLWFFDTSAGMRFYESMAVAPLRDKVIETICEHFTVNKDLVASTTSLTEFVGTDSLDLVELVMLLEEEFDFTFPEVEAREIRVVGDLIDIIAKRNL